MKLAERISTDAEGRAVVDGTELTVTAVLEMLGAGESESEILSKYPGLTHADITACLAYGVHAVREFSCLPLGA